MLELGPGSGYFSAAIAEAIPNGHLELVDVQPEMLAKTRAKLTRRGFHTVGYTVADAGRPMPLPSKSFDLAVLVHVLGEVGDERASLKSLHGTLKPSAFLVIHEGWPDPDFIALNRLQPLVESEGFALDRTYGPDWNYTAVFRCGEDA